MSTLWGTPVHFEAVDTPARRFSDRPRARSHRSALETNVYLVSRVLLGAMFVLFGVNGFVMFMPSPPAIPQEAMTFFGMIMTTHFSYLVFGAQLIAGLLVLFNRYMPLAIVTLAAVLANIWAFHITMYPAGIFPMPIIATVLWFTVAWSIRSSFAPLLAMKVEAR